MRFNETILSTELFVVSLQLYHPLVLSWLMTNGEPKKEGEINLKRRHMVRKITYNHPLTDLYFRTTLSLFCEVIEHRQKHCCRAVVNQGKVPVDFYLFVIFLKSVECQESQTCVRNMATLFLDLATVKSDE